MCGGVRALTIGSGSCRGVASPLLRALGAPRGAEEDGQGKAYLALIPPFSKTLQFAFGSSISFIYLFFFF